MNILSVKNLAIPEVKVIRYGRFLDSRGYFSESFRQNSMAAFPGAEEFKNIQFFQTNESYSKAGAARGLHLQYNPYMGKLVRTIAGRMVDMALDARKGSPTFGKIILYDMPAKPENDSNEWIWLPPGFAHGNFFPQESTIEYLCSGEYNPKCEAGISFLAGDLDWSLCEPALKSLFDSIVPQSVLVSQKDKQGLTLAQWSQDSRSDNFVYGKV